jgi:hypothetical protein
MSNNVVKDWEETQHRTFTAWANMILQRYHDDLQEERAWKPMTDLITGLHNGVNLIFMLRELTGVNIPVPEMNPTSKFHCLENLKVAIDFLTEYKEEPYIALVNLNAQDILDGNLKIILGLMWVIIRRFQLNLRVDVSDLNSVKEIVLEHTKLPKPHNVTNQEKDLLDWVNGELRNAGYETVTNFTTDFQSGKALYNLVHIFVKGFHLHHRLMEDIPIENDPEYDMNDALSQSYVITKRAIQVAHDLFGITQLMTARDIVYNPDKSSMMTFLSFMRQSIVNYMVEMEMQLEVVEEIEHSNDTKIQIPLPDFSKNKNSSGSSTKPPPIPEHLLKQKRAAESTKNRQFTTTYTTRTVHEPVSFLYTAKMLLNHYRNKIYK